MGAGFCYDCIISFGVPFPLWEEDGFVGVNRILWSGLIADFYLALTVGLLIRWMFERFSSRRSASE